ncbi:uncharacterized protein M421DRAFT_418570 [Didymella exigua CBS 183.55]|uniref:CENP-V/GFA domain-containing protein n=1 Tax=Didymella exigua CBS 183.55 TaxID=1150837 RepID=A0A6A5RR60_9PLEO|nr:uncharacterized protein M421DRAFT_418570 [Didymella exigua CBS 183.55]KAF1930252.1 hypothetical protein M421DRAFT_418570 [Didymella exigua CBS 183.55]
MSEEEQTRTGACLCKKITFEVKGTELNFTICHCTNCRRNCGATYTANAWFPDAHFKWTSGGELLKQYSDRETETGEAVYRSFCTNCGSPMLTKSPRMPGITIIPSGVFDGNHEWKPSYEQWRRSKVCFVDDIWAVENVGRYGDHPDLKEFEGIWSRSGTRPAQEFVDR